MSDLIQAPGCMSGRSRCKNNPQIEHPCPFQEDVNNDSDFQCTCCEDCTIACADDI
jgi:hypothetical protein